MATGVGAVSRLAAAAVRAGEGLAWPDPLLRAGVAALVGRSARKLADADNDADRAFAAEMATRPIAIATDAANAQHYEVPAAFFALMLGPDRKYSCCLYPDAHTTLAEAEAFALAETASHADLGDGQRILELGCGWGSLTLWMAQHFPHARITAVSNSGSQRAFIEASARERGLDNVTVITADMNAFTPPAAGYDRVVSVEMFEHMSNWRPLLAGIRSWLTPDGRAFLHVFSHRRAPYRFDINDRSDWIAQHFFTGGTMPSHSLIRQFEDVMQVEQDWWWSGTHYRRTADHWLENFDRNRDAIDATLREVYGDEAALWRRRWRLFLLATAGLFGHGGGETWGVSHYRLRPAG